MLLVVVVVVVIERWNEKKMGSGKQVRNIVHYVHERLPLAPSHTRWDTILNHPITGSARVAVCRCSFHSDRILPHGRSKQRNPPNRLCPTSTGHLTRKERHRFRFCSPSQPERINRITYVLGRALQFKGTRSHRGHLIPISSILHPSFLIFLKR